jgi:hypothetical protein
MLLLAGDGIHENTESIIQYVGRYSGLHLTFGLVEIAGYEMPDGRLLVQPCVLARTANIERVVVRVEGSGADLAAVITPEQATSQDIAEEGAEATSRRSFDPALLEADRRWRVEIVKRLQLDDPAQAVGRVGFGRVFVDLPVPWAWMTVYTSRRNNTCGNSVVLKGDAGAKLFQALKAQQQDIDAELSATTGVDNIVWNTRDDLCFVYVWRQFPNGWTVAQEAVEMDWLLGATNAFVNIFRPRILWSLQRGAVAAGEMRSG